MEEVGRGIFVFKSGNFFFLEFNYWCVKINKNNVEIKKNLERSVRKRKCGIIWDINKVFI